MSQKARLVRIAALTAAIVTAFEAVKQAVSPGLSAWESHTITIVVVSAAVTLAAHFVFGRTSKVEAKAKAAESARDQSEAALRAFINALPEPAFIIDDKKICLAANEAMAKRLRHPISELLNRDLFELVPDIAIRKNRVSRIDEVIRTGQHVTFADEREGRHYANHIFPSLDSHGKVRTVAAVALDISDLRQAERALAEQEQRAELAVQKERAAAEAILRASEERLRIAMEAARIGVWDWRIPSDEMEWSAGATPFWKSGTTLKGPFARCMQVVLADDRRGVEQAFSECKNGGRSLLAIDCRVVAANGDVRWIEVRGRVFPDEQGRAQRMAGTFLDITERRILEEQLARGEKMKTIGKLAGGIAHDFNNLLTVMLTYGQFLHDFRPADERITELAAPILDAAERAAALTRQLLMFSQPDVIAPKVLDLNDLIASASRLLTRLVGEHVRVETTLSPGLWHVRMDQSQCEQVLLNLAVNARDAMPRGGTLRITTENVPRNTSVDGDASDNDRVVITISDSGEGMSDEVKSKAFQAFFTTKPQGRGTGIGLATCQTVVTNAGGTIRLESALGLGTTFRIFLPRTDDELSRGGRSRWAPQKSTASESILVVEDEVLVRSTVERILRAAGYRVVGAGDGMEALQLLKARPGEFRLIVADVVMPRMGGVELAKAAREHSPDLRILFTSGYPGDALLDHELGDDVTLLAKPYTADDLTRRVRGLLDKRGS